MTTAPYFSLPGRWLRVPLSSEAAMRTSIRKTMDELTNRRDELARVRAELRERFTAAAELARSGGASDLFLGLELMPGLPLPAWIAVFPADYENADFDALGFGDFTKALDLAAGPAPSGGSRTESDIDAPTAIHVVRHAWRRTTEVVEADVETTFEFVEADYWIAAREPNRLALVTFSTALAEYEAEMLELFDAIISTVKWKVPGAVPA